MASFNSLPQNMTEIYVENFLEEIFRLYQNHAL